MIILCLALFTCGVAIGYGFRNSETKSITELEKVVAELKKRQ